MDYIIIKYGDKMHGVKRIEEIKNEWTRIIEKAKRNSR
jgi:hypothetical protein